MQAGAPDATAGTAEPAAAEDGARVVEHLPIMAQSPIGIGDSSSTIALLAIAARQNGRLDPEIHAFDCDDRFLRSKPARSPGRTRNADMNTVLF